MTDRTTPQASHISTVRQHLLDTLAELRNKEAPMEIARAKAVAEVASVLIESAKVEVDYLRATKQDCAPFLEAPPDASVAHLGHSSAGDRPAAVGQNGITGITRHRLLG